MEFAKLVGKMTVAGFVYGAGHCALLCVMMKIIDDV